MGKLDFPQYQRGEKYDYKTGNVQKGNGTCKRNLYQRNQGFCKKL